MLDPKLWTREELERHSVDMRQFIDFRQSTLPNGMRIIEAYNASGLTFTILPDRGLDIWTAHYKGIPLTWLSQGSPHPPDFGQPWLRQFNGGLLTTCGLTHAGQPETDDVTGEVRDLHGLYSRLRAEDVRVERRGWTDDASDYEIELSGVVTEARLFSEQLRLERTYFIGLRSPAIYIEDKVTNLGDKPSPLMLLYHFNFGYPLVAGGAQLHTPYHAVYPRNEVARGGLARWPEYDAATPGYDEQVFFHHLMCERHDKSTTLALLAHENFGVKLGWNANELPYLTQWKNTRQGIYVCGVEPGNCIPEGQNAARRNKRLRILEPGESQEFSCDLVVLPDSRSVASHKKTIEEWRESGVPVKGCHLEDFTK